MRIAVNATSLKNNRYQIFLELAALHPEHTFLFFFDNEKRLTDFPENIIPVVITPQATNLLKRRIWYHLKLPAVFKKNKPDIFISERFISLKTKVPQILMQPDLTYIHQPAFIEKKEIGFFKKNSKKFIETANEIVVSSSSLKNEIVNRFKTDDKKITVIYPSIKEEFDATTYEEREIAKEKYAEGNEYFIYKGIISPQQNLTNLLKAFSFFKKRQRSKMQLIITGERGEKYDEFVRLLQSYRFRNDVKLLEEVTPNETEKILASAYAFLYVPFYESEGDEVIEAMQSGVPLIVSNTQFLKEYCADSALYVEPEKINDISEKMMLLFKDEQKRKELIENGRIQIKKFSEAKNTDSLLKRIEETVV
ncbi:MAG: glycosyltransferase family 4 protein [Bacteroidota bacterium]|nr:glycosyltransferase family 4 protein [Bacteroidota bacterium]